MPPRAWVFRMFPSSHCEVPFHSLLHLLCLCRPTFSPCSHHQAGPVGLPMPRAWGSDGSVCPSAERLIGIELDMRTHSVRVFRGVHDSLRELCIRGGKIQGRDGSERRETPLCKVVALWDVVHLVCARPRGHTREKKPWT